MNLKPGILSFALALLPLSGFAADKWKFAGDTRGISFHILIANQCQAGGKVDVKLKNGLDHPVIASFRLNDADWRKSFTRELEANGSELTFTYIPEDETTVCHPYIDQIYVESKEPMVSQALDSIVED